MLREDVTPNYITFPFVLKECVKRSDFFAGRSIHAHIVKLGFDIDVFVQNSLISLYGESGCLANARRVFDEMPNRDVVSWNSLVIGVLRNGELDVALDLFRRMKDKNIISWNSMITGFVQGGRCKEALEFFHEMQVLGDDMVSPDKVTIASVLSACASLGAVDHGRWIHGYLKRSMLECDMVIGTAFVDMYGKCGFVDTAFEIFRAMPKKDVLTWTAMISVFALHGRGREAFELFAEMEANGIRPNAVTFTGLLSACAHSGLVEKGRYCFDMMKRIYSIEPHVQHYACMVDTLSRAGHFDEALELVKTMPMEPDVFAWGALLGGCQMHGNMELGEKVALYLIYLDPLNHAFYADLCDVYAKAGRYHELKRVRAQMNDRGIKKTVPGCSLIEIDGTVYEFSVRGFDDIVMEEIKCLLTRLTIARVEVVVLQCRFSEETGRLPLYYCSLSPQETHNYTEATGLLDSAAAQQI
ncbi:hypothetical protein M9H77_10538 [Catharanthus roseus]|uniref:Uncharacterized protein n=1 Tax=Catharanthus roseus TaxID=4058 RepID=A0ACC0BBY6_CATRO|nr:hypothetical protein M9H77_10538 [Catharanthus roseus]